LLATGLYSCDIKKSNVSPDAVFTNVYHDNDLNTAYYPLDINQAGNGELTILSGIKNDSSKYTWNGVYIMETDKDGKYLWKITSLSGFVNPVSGMFTKNNTTYFLCMDEITLQTYLMNIDKTERNIAVVKTFPTIEYPLYSLVTSDGGQLVISYDRASRSSKISKIDGNFNISWQQTYNVLEDAEEKVIFHLTHLGRQFPFFASEVKNGNTATHYAVNTFFNYSFSLLVINAANGTQTGVVNGYRYDGAVSSALHLSENQFAISRYSFGDNYLLPQTEVDIDAISSTNNYTGTRYPEFNTDARVYVCEKGSADKKRIIYATSSKIGQLVVVQFNYETGNWINTQYFGHSNPVEIASMLNTSDDGMLLLSRMMVAGRYPRIALFKVSSGAFQ
jgi:hypothetical protein